MIISPRIRLPGQAVAPIRINRSSPFARGLVAWYPLGDAQSWGQGSQIFDCSGRSHHGTTLGDEYGGYPATYGQSGWSFGGAGSTTVGSSSSLHMFDDPVLIDHDRLKELQSPFSFTCWMMRGNEGNVFAQYSAAGSHRLIKKLSCNANQVSYVMTKSDGNHQFLTTPSVTNMVMQHTFVFLAVSVRGGLGGGDARIVVNNRLFELTYTALSSTPDMSVALLLGAKIGSGGTGHYETLQANLRDCRFYNRALSAAELKQLYRETKGRMTGDRTGNGGQQIPAGWGSLAQQYRPIPYATEGAAATALPAAMNTYQQMMRGS